jgi:sulfonate transport system ATP-binding protein
VDEAIYLSDRILVMNPGRIVDEIAVDLPLPRDRAGAEFASIKRRILERMGEYAPRAEAA